MDTRSAEFRYIKQYFQRALSSQHQRHIQLGIGDDCSILSLAENEQLLISVDTSLANKHFPDTAAADVIGARALNVALSDLAAMGAQPLAFM